MLLRLLLAVVCSLTTSIAYSQQLTPNEIRRVDEIIGEYVRNEAKAANYCVTMKIDRAVVAHKDPAKSRSTSSWQTFAFDAHRKARRYDEIKELNNQLGLPTPLSTSVFHVEEKIGIRSNRRLVSEFDSDSSDTDDARLGIGAMRIEPWELPFADSGIFREEIRIIVTRPKYSESISGRTLANVDIAPFAVMADFMIDKQNNLLKRIVFDKNCNNLPTVCQVYLRSGVGKDDLLLSTSQTEWAKYESEDLFLPSHVKFTNVVGNPGNPSQTNVSELELKWVLGNQLSEKVFQFDDTDAISATELRDAVLDNAVKVTPLMRHVGHSLNGN
jgi:hypothetical protein